MMLVYRLENVQTCTRKTHKSDLRECSTMPTKWKTPLTPTHAFCKHVCVHVDVQTKSTVCISYACVRAFGIHIMRACMSYQHVYACTCGHAQSSIFTCTWDASMYDAQYDTLRAPQSCHRYLSPCETPSLMNMQHFFISGET
jgi:hypothetical protein